MSDRINLDDPDFNQNQVTIQNDKAKKIWGIIGALAAFLIIVIIVMQSGSSGSNNKSNTPDPNRTSEYCSLYGETKVFPAINHTRCISDGDGYYNPVFGHHHHK